MTVQFASGGNALTFKRFLKLVLCSYKGCSQIIMVLDNVAYHHARKIKAWLIHHPKLELMFLPPYSPELNAVERVWWWMRKQITHNRSVATLKQRKGLFWKLFSQLTKPNDKIK